MRCCEVAFNFEKLNVALAFRALNQSGHEDASCVVNNLEVLIRGGLHFLFRAVRASKMAGEIVLRNRLTAPWARHHLGFGGLLGRVHGWG